MNFLIKIIYYSVVDEDNREFFTHLPIIPLVNSSMMIKTKSGGMECVIIKSIFYVLNKEDEFEFIELIVTDS